jgi:hypothetical protein
MKSSIPWLLLFVAMCSSSLGLVKHIPVYAMSRNASDSIRTQTDAGSHSALWIKDSTEYSKSFLKELAAFAPANTRLLDSLMVLGGSDTVHFPADPPLRKVLSFSATFHDVDLFLVLVRMNQTSIDFKLELSNAFGEHIEQKGIAELSPAFYLGAEVDENSFSGNSYFSTEYTFQQDSCFTVLRIGIKDGFSSKYLAKIIKNCNGAFGYLGLDDFPTLLEEQ